MAESATDVAHRARRSAWAVGVLAIALLVVAGAILFAAVNRPAPWSPLGPNSIQTVEEPRDNTDTPVVHLSDPVVHVTGRKCVEGDGFIISGTVAWQSVEPRGSIIRTGEAVSDAVDGCTTGRWRNDIPPAVLDVMGRQIADGLHPLWRITGTETPIDEQRGEGVPVTWATEPFRITR